MHLLLLLFFTLPQHLYIRDLLPDIARRTQTIELATINCHITCKTDALFCDNVVIDSNGKYAATLELPWKKLTEHDKQQLLKTITDSNTYKHSIRRGNIITEIGDVSCFNPTLAMLLKDKEGIVFAHALIDIDCRHFAMYWLVNGRYKPVYSETDDLVTFGELNKYGFTYMVKRYKLECELLDNH